MGIVKSWIMKLFYSAPFLKIILEEANQIECLISRHWVSGAHRRAMAIQWKLPPVPEHFDHHNDLFYQWLATRNPLWLERGIYGALALQGGDVLELSCGDGFNARNFYSLRSRNVIACDFDPKAIKTARSKNSTANVEFVLADIRYDMPTGKFENVVWDAAIEHFTPDESDKIIKDTKSRLTSNGILSGYTVVERSDRVKVLPHHEYEFTSKQDLHRFFTSSFRYVTVFETIYPSRHNLYFWASDGCLPFRSDWPFVVTEMSE